MTDNYLTDDDIGIYTTLAMDHVRGKLTLSELKDEINKQASDAELMMEICKDEFEWD